jgi:hypothetical protein
MEIGSKKGEKNSFFSRFLMMGSVSDSGGRLGRWGGGGTLISY